MTADHVPPPGTELVVAARRPLLRGLGWPLMVIGAACAVLAVLLVIVLVHGAGRDRLIGELACQVQQLGGDPIGGVDCPPTVKPAPAVRRTPTPAASSKPAPMPTIVVVLPDGTMRTVAASPAARSTSSPRSKASSSPRATPSPSPLVQICPPRLPCFP